MKINREKAKAVFTEYVSHYNGQDEKVRLKVEHTFRVSELCEEIAGFLSLSDEEVDLAWLTGLLHDVGRFEQLKNFGTFIDADSIDHAQYGADILFRQGRIRDYVESRQEDQLMETAVRFHSAYRLPEGLDEKTERFCHILRDADKIDIYKVNVDFPLEEIYNVTTQELVSCQVTEEVMQSFDEGHAVLRSLRKTPADNVVGHISMAHELVFPISQEIVAKQGYLKRLLDFQSENPKAREQFQYIRERMKEYL